MQGLGKKILPEEKRKVEIFLDQLAKPLQGAKRLLRQRGSEHRFPAYTLTIAREYCIEVGTKRETLEPRPDGTLYCAGIIKPRKIFMVLPTNWWHLILLKYVFQSDLFC